MSLSDRRRFLVLALAGAASACGFQPVRKKGAAARNLEGRVELPEPTDPISYAYRERMRRRIGAAGSAADYRLDSKVTLDETGIAITQASDITRYRLNGVATWKLVDLESGDVIAEDSVTAFTGYDATASAYAARSAEKAARIRLAKELAELTASRLTAMINKTAGS